ncbi:transposase [Paenibacillus sp. 19GGS1-52]|uniref:transposase n=1 Tax=Paenibacillus sp. 19GGS1-52 TaxID=2758563 RepID=UPI001EFB81C0|nr:transposase [Paenibacillus sp. 19GGS1-52]
MYIQYTMDPFCLPMDLEEDIPENHLVRVVNEAVHRLDDAIFDAAYPGGGRDSYHPKMLTKIIIYAYTQRIYSSRQIASGTRKHSLREEHECLGRDLPELGESSKLSSEKLEQVTQKLKAQLLEKPKNKPLKKVVRKLRKDLLPRLLKYEQYQVLLGDRNSFSKADPEATFMRMKEDHMRNGQFKPGYNVQIRTENQFILTYSLHPRPTDTRCLQPHMEKARQILGKLPQTVIADAGYGSEKTTPIWKRKRFKR